MLTQQSIRNIPQCPCSNHSGSVHSTAVNRNGAAEIPERSSSGTLTDAILAEHSRQTRNVHTSKENSSEVLKKLTTAAKSLGINTSDLFNDEQEGMRGILPMERFLAEEEQSLFGKAMAENKHAAGKHT